jgi:hypothetical protein
MVPEGWRADGRIVWLPEYSIASNLELILRDPASGLCVQWLPSQSLTFMSNPPFPMQPGANYMGRIWMQPITDPAEFVSWAYAGQTLPELRNAKPIGGEDFQNQARYYQAQMTVAGQKLVRSVRLRYEFAGADGQPWEEDVYFTLAFNNSGQAVMWDVFGAIAVRGPKGSLDANRTLTHAIVQSTEFTPQWLAARTVVQQLFHDGLRQMQRDQAIIAQKLAAYRDHIARLSQQMYEQRMQANDARNEAFREVLGGVENYRDPYQPLPVYLPAGYKEYWSNAKGEYILSDEWNYNPNVGTTEEWKKIERIDPMKR